MNTLTSEQRPNIRLSPSTWCVITLLLQAVLHWGYQSLQRTVIVIIHQSLVCINFVLTQ